MSWHEAWKISAEMMKKHKLVSPAPVVRYSPRRFEQFKLDIQEFLEYTRSLTIKPLFLLQDKRAGGRLN